MPRGSKHERDEAPPPARKPARVVIADGDPLARRVVRSQLEHEPGFEVVAETGTAAEIAELVRAHDAQLAVMELQMPGVDGMNTVAQIVRDVGTAAILIFTVMQGDEVAVAALRAGARGVLQKDMGVEAVVAALTAMLRGEAAIPRALTMRVIELLRGAPDSGAGLRPVRSELTTREWEVLDHLCAGRNTREVAEALVLSEDTVYSHVKNIMRKLHVHTRAEAVERANQVRGQAVGA